MASVFRPDTAGSTVLDGIKWLSDVDISHERQAASLIGRQPGSPAERCRVVKQTQCDVIGPDVTITNICTHTFLQGVHAMGTLDDHQL